MPTPPNTTVEERIREEWKNANKGIPMIGSGAYGKHLGCCGGDYCEGEHNDRIADWWLQELSSARKEVLEEERQFILNILDGIDIADEQMGNKGGGTKAIRLALASRSLT